MSDPSTLKRLQSQLRLQSKLIRERLAGPKKTRSGSGWPERLEKFHSLLDTIFKIFVALLSATVMAGVIFALWSAFSSSGVVVNALSVPDTLKQQGLSGQVIASRLVDHFVYMQSRSLAIRPAAPHGIQVAPPDIPIKVELSEAGVSLGEVYSFLRSSISHEIYINGDVYVQDIPGADATKGPAPYTLTLHASNLNTVPCSETGANLDFLIDDLAGCIFRQEQPYRYAAYITSRFEGDDKHDACHDNGVPKQARNILERYLAEHALLTGRKTQDEETAWVADELGYRFATDCYDYHAAIAQFQNALRADSELTLAYRDLVDAEEAYGQDEAALKHTETLLGLLARSSKTLADPQTRKKLQTEYQAELADERGNYAGAAKLNDTAAALDAGDEDYEDNAMEGLIKDLAFTHDVRGLRQAVSRASDNVIDSTRFWIAVALGQWHVANALGNKALSQCTAEEDCMAERSVLPVVLEVRARTGNPPLDPKQFAQIPATTRSDESCYACLYELGAAYGWRWQRWDKEGIWLDARANLWFARAVAAAPSMPFAYVQWARLLIRQHRYDRAIAMLAAANAKAPLYADPLLVWGEALIKQGHPRDALTKLDAAAKLAPSWEQIYHLKVKTLAALHKSVEAAQQAERERRLALNPDDLKFLGLCADRACAPQRDE